MTRWQNDMKKIVIDLDLTLTTGAENGYWEADVNSDVLETLMRYKEQGFYIVVFTARNMRTYEGNVGLINKNTLPLIMRWLEKHCVPYDEIIVGKPWCGHDGFYVDDKAIRPEEFTKLSYQEIRELINA